MIGYIYSLSCSLTGDVFYIGCTTINPESRLASHIYSIPTGNTLLYEYMKKSGISPVIEIIEEVVFKNKSTLFDAEEFWIEQFRQWGFTLKNSTNNTPAKIRKRNPLGSGSIKVNGSILNEVKDFCKENGILMYRFGTEALKDRLNKLRNEKTTSGAIQE